MSLESNATPDGKGEMMDDADQGGNPLAAALADVQSQLFTIAEFGVGYRARLQALGMSATVAEQIAAAAIVTVQSHVLSVGKS